MDQATNVNAQFFFIFFILIAAAFSLYYFYFRKKEDDKPAQNSYLLGLKYLTENDNRRAIEQLKEAVRHDSQNIDAYIKLGDILRDEGLNKNAVRIHKDLTLRANIVKEDMDRIYYSLALDHWGANQFDKAAENFKKITGIKEYRPKILPYMVKYYEMNEDYENAFQTLSKSYLSSKPEARKKLALYRVFEGLNLVDKGSEKEARIKFKDALKHDDKCVAAHMYIGDSYLREDRTDDAINIWTEFCKKDPQKADVLFPRLEKAWFEKGQFLKIRQLYETILKSDPDNLHALLALSNIHTKKGDFKTALILIEDSFKQNMNEAILKKEIARIHFEKSQYKESAQKALEVLDETPGFSARLFICPSCGFQSDEPFWKCVKCKNIAPEL